MNKEAIIPDRLEQWHAQQENIGARTETVRKIKEGFELSVASNADGSGERLLLLRNDSVFTIPILRTRDGVFTVLTKEFRFTIGGEGLQFPAETSDVGETYEDAVVRGISEETTIDLAWLTDITSLSEGDTNFVSPGGTNEQVFYFAADFTVPDNVDIQILDGQHTGVDDDEDITTVVRPLNRELLQELEIVGDKMGLLLALEREQLTSLQA